LQPGQPPAHQAWSRPLRRPLSPTSHCLRWPGLQRRQQSFGTAQCGGLAEFLRDCAQWGCEVWAGAVNVYRNDACLR
jgi:hypothetical protein